MSIEPEVKRHAIILVLVLFALLLVVPLLSYSVIRIEGPRIRQEALAELNAIGKLKDEQIESWLARLRGDAGTLMAQDGFVEDMTRWLDQHDPLAEARIARLQANLRHTFSQWIIFSADTATDDWPAERRALLTAALDSGQPRMGELYRDADGRIWLEQILPLIEQKMGRRVGGVILRSEAASYLFPFVQSWPTPSPSAETLLIRRDGDSVLFLNQLRHQADSALRFRLPLNNPDLPAAIAIHSGKAQSVEGRDYRGVAVLAAVRPVRETTWFLVTKVDREEVLQPLYKLVTWVSIVAMVAILAVALLLFLFWRQQRRSQRLEMLARTGERDRLLNLFYDLPFMGMAIIDPEDGAWLHANDCLSEMLGYPRETLLADTTWRQIIHPDDLPKCMAHYQRLQADELDGYQVETRLLRADGGIIDSVTSVKCVRKPNGRVDYVVMTVRDVSERKRLQTARAEQQQATGLLEAIAAASADAIFAKDTQGNYLFFNAAAAHEIDRPQADVLGRDDSALFPAEIAERIKCQDRAIMADGLSTTFEESYPRHDGTRTYLTTKGPLHDSSGRTIGIYGIARDITARKFAEEQLRRSQAQWRLFIEQAPLSIAMFDQNMNYLAYSQRWLEDYARGHDNLIGRHCYTVHPDIPATWKTIHRRGLAGETLHSDADQWVREDGSERWLRWATLPWREASGVIGGIIVFAEDISERYHIEQALSESRTRLAGIIDSAMDAIISLDVQQRIRMFNPAAERMFGYQAKEIIGEPIERLLPMELREIHALHVQRFAAGDTNSMTMPRLGELRALHRDGSIFPIEVSISKAYVAGEWAFTAILRDVSERKHAEEALRYQLDLIRGITEQSTDSIFINDSEGRVTAVNPEAERTFGYKTEELVGKVLHDVIHHQHPDGRPFPMRACPLCRVYHDGEVIRNLEDVVFRKDGSRLIVTASNAALRSGGKIVGCALVLHDITAIKEAEQALREREDDLNRAQSVGHIGSWRLDIRQNILTWSAENYRIFGVAEDAPMTYEFFLSRVHPDDRSWVDQTWRDALQGKPYDIEHRLLVDGEVKWVREIAELEFDAGGALTGGFGTTQDISERKAAEQALEAARASAIEEKTLLETIMQTLPVGVVILDLNGGIVRHNPDYARIWSGPRPSVHKIADYAAYRAWWVDSGRQLCPEEWAPTIALRQGELVTNQLLQIQRFDGTRAFVLNSAAPIRDARGAIIGCAVVIQDITELKQAEQSLREADQRKDEFLAMLAHELRNPLVPIRNAAHVLGRLDLHEPRVNWARDIIERQVAQLTHLVDELLDVSRIAQGKIILKKTHFALNDLLRQACESVQPLMTSKGHHLEVAHPDGTIMIEGDLVRLVQVLQNLLNNAAKYTPDGGHIELSAQARGGDVEIQVRDNGMGIPADLLPGVFDLFRQGERTLDRAQGGLGIGLTLVKRLVELHAGKVEVQSPGPGQGATFSIRLPATEQSTFSDTSNVNTACGDSPRLRVLVVDDDPVVAESMVIFLELEGNQVRSADSGDTALELMQAFKPHVVLLDIGLPGQDGYAVAKRIRSTPGGETIKLVAVSGYGHDSALERSREAGFDHHLVKPVAPEMLSALLHELGTPP